MAKNLSLTTKEAEERERERERERRLLGDSKQLRSQQQQSLGALHARIDARLERRTQAIMYRLLDLLGNRRGSKNRGTHSREASREPRVARWRSIRTSLWMRVGRDLEWKQMVIGG